MINKNIRLKLYQIQLSVWPCGCRSVQIFRSQTYKALTHWGRVTHICVGKLTIIGSVNDLTPGRRQAIIWTNAGILLIRTLGTNFNDFLSEIRAFSFKKMHFKMSSGKWRPSCLGLNVLNCHFHYGGMRHSTAWQEAISDSHELAWINIPNPSMVK